MQRVDDWPNLAAMMFGLARQRPSRPMLRHYEDGAWHGTTWAAFATKAASAARGLRAAGIAAGDRVLMVSESRPEIPILETALMAIRAIPVPAYVTNTPDDHAHLLRDSGARTAIASNPDLAARVAIAAAQTTGLDNLFCMTPKGVGSNHRPLAPLFDDQSSPDDIAAETAIIPQGSLACLIYTSGTSGPPRGVMLPHRAILSNIAGIGEFAARTLNLDGSVYLSFLPLSHSYEHTVGQFILPALGSEVVYGRGLEHLAADLQTVRPTILTVVPRMLEVIRTRIQNQLKRDPAWKRRLFEQTLAAGLRRVEGQSTLADRLAAPLLDRLVRSKVRARFGGRLIGLISGGARLDPETGRFFDALGLPLLQGYGQTEAGPVISVNLPTRPRNTTVGHPLPGIEVRTAKDGEVLVKGDLVMDGYWNDAEATALTLRDGWLHTGDLGRLHPDGTLEITDRKKDIIVLSGGENVSPARIEGLLMNEPEIQQAVIGGEGQAGLSALIVPAEGETAQTVAAAIGRVNQGLSVTERIRRHKIVPAFTIENGLLTPSQKIRRSIVLEAYGTTAREGGMTSTA